MVDPRSIITTFTPLGASNFNLVTSGVIGLLGGDEAISAMATVNLYKGRRWLGWYNSPGSYQIAKQYGLVGTSDFFKGLFPGVRTNPAKLFGFNGWQGPRFRAVHSGTIMGGTGHLASVVVKRCAAEEITKDFSRAERDGPGYRVSIVKLTPKSAIPKEISIEHSEHYSSFIAIIPIASSLATWIASGVYKDWISFGLILWGILANGISCMVIGSGTLHFTHHIPASGSPLGDGVLDSSKHFVFLKGDETTINAITLGEFSLTYSGEFGDTYIGCCAVLLILQFLAQLLFIPQASLFGQIMFICSLAVSWVYNSWLSVTLNKDEIQQRILWECVLQTPRSKSYTCSSRTSAVVFALCILSSQDQENLDKQSFLEAYLPKDTKVWKQWSETVSTRLREREALHFESGDWEIQGWSDADQRLLETLYNDAMVAYDAAT